MYEEHQMGSERRERATITLPASLLRRIRRAMGISKRNLSAEFEYGMERHVEEIEKKYGLTVKHLRDDWPE